MKSPIATCMAITARTTDPVVSPARGRRDRTRSPTRLPHQHRWPDQPEGFGGSQVDHQRKLRWLLDQPLRDPGAFEKPVQKPVQEPCGLAVVPGITWPASHRSVRHCIRAQDVARSVGFGQAPDADGQRVDFACRVYRHSGSASSVRRRRSTSARRLLDQRVEPLGPLVALADAVVGIFRQQT